MTVKRGSAAGDTADGAGNVLAWKQDAVSPTFPTTKAKSWLGGTTQLTVTHLHNSKAKNGVSNIISLSPPSGGELARLEDNNGRAGFAINKRRRRSWRRS